MNIFSKTFYCKRQINKDICSRDKVLLQPRDRLLTCQLSRVSDPHFFFADPDPGKNFYADPDPDPVPDPDPGGIRGRGLGVKGKNDFFFFLSFSHVSDDS